MRKLLVAAIAALVSVMLVSSPASAARDSDKDGIPNKWEKGKTPQGLNLKKLGANPKHKDVFLELSYSTKSGPDKVSCAALDALYNAWKNSPLTNPDGRTGVNLHLDAGKKCPSRSYNIKRGNKRFTVAGACATPLDYANVLSEKRLRIFHVGAIVTAAEMSGPNCSAEGQAGHTDFLVKDQNGSSFLGYVMMHELGHVFGLDHGPFNGFSVMSGGAYRYGPSTGEPVIDFLRFPVNALNEAALDENVGYRSTSAAGNAYLAQFWGPQFCGSPSLTLQGPAAGPIDWNCSGAPFWMPPYSQYIDAGTVAYDVNNDGTIGTVPAVPAEWPRINLRVGRLAAGS